MSERAWGYFGPYIVVERQPSGLPGLLPECPRACGTSRCTRRQYEWHATGWRCRDCGGPLTRLADPQATPWAPLYRFSGLWNPVVLEPYLEPLADVWLPRPDGENTRRYWELVPRRWADPATGQPLPRLVDCSEGEATAQLQEAESPILALVRESGAKLEFRYGRVLLLR